MTTSMNALDGQATGTLHDSVTLLPENLHEDITILRSALLHIAPLTPLLELLDIFGPISTIRFLETFAGSLMHVPSKDDLARAVRDAAIFSRIRRHNESINRVARLYALDWHTVRSIYARMQATLGNDLAR